MKEFLIAKIRLKLKKGIVHDLTEKLYHPIIYIVLI